MSNTLYLLLIFNTKDRIISLNTFAGVCVSMVSSVRINALPLSPLSLIYLILFYFRIIQVDLYSMFCSKLSFWTCYMQTARSERGKGLYMDGWQQPTFEHKGIVTTPVERIRVGSRGWALMSFPVEALRSIWSERLIGTWPIATQ